MCLPRKVCKKVDGREQASAEVHRSPHKLWSHAQCLTRDSPCLRVCCRAREGMGEEDRLEARKSPRKPGDDAVWHQKTRCPGTSSFG